MGMFLELVLISLVTPIGSCNCMGVVSILQNHYCSDIYCPTTVSLCAVWVVVPSLSLLLDSVNCSDVLSVFCLLFWRPAPCVSCLALVITSFVSDLYLHALHLVFMPFPWCWSPSWIPSSSISRLGSNMNAAAPCYLVSLYNLLSFCSHTSVSSLIDHAGFDVC